MCGRFSLFAETKDLEREYNLKYISDHNKRYNIAPNQEIPIIIYDEESRANKLVNAYWGFIPEWAKDIRDIVKPINAKSETLQEKPYFRRAFAQKRCLIPTNGFYEWDKSSKPSVPLRFCFQDNKLFSFAGLWSLWKGEGEEKDFMSCTIITTGANAIIQTIHERMPAILTKDEYDDWLDPRTDEQKLKIILQTKKLADLIVYPVSSFINTPKNDNEACIKRV